MNTPIAMLAIINTFLSLWFGLYAVANLREPWAMMPNGVLAVVLWCLAIS